MKYIIALLTLGLASTSFAQNYSDALQFSRTDISGSARFVAMGGSFGALGGEISGISVNPGGIGVYRNSEFTFTAGFNNYNAETTFRGSNAVDGRFNMKLPNVGYVGNYKINSNGWKSYSFGILHNRLNHFGSEQRASGNSNNSTYIDQYVNVLNQNNPSISSLENFDYPFGSSQAWWLSMVDQVEDPNDRNSLIFIPRIYNTSVLGAGRSIEKIEQSRTFDTRGNQAETQFVFGGNFMDKLYVGASVSVQTVSFEREVSFREEYSYLPTVTAQDSNLVVNYQEDTRLLSEGRGVNLKVGGIYRATEDLRVGLSFQTPTIMRMDEVFSIDASSQFADGFEVVAESVESTFSYRLRTPARVTASLAYIILQRAAINVDYEYIDYSTAFFNDRQGFQNDYSFQNLEIQDILTNAHHVRVGGEFKINPFVLRAGYSYQGNPYDPEFSISDESRNTYSLGGGFRNKNFNFDVGVNWRQMTLNERFYSSTDAMAAIEETETNVIFTFGWRW